MQKVSDWLRLCIPRCGEQESSRKSPDVDQNQSKHRQNKRYGQVESYARFQQIGEGTFSTVFKGVSHITNQVIALKEYKLKTQEGIPGTAIEEISILKRLKHRNIVVLHDILSTSGTLTIVLEYVPKNLRQYMNELNMRLTTSCVKFFLIQLLEGLAYCHGQRIMHRDLKPENILINERNELKIADFGMARTKSFYFSRYSNNVVTLWYRPPDVLQGSTEYSTSIDMWSVGCIFYEMAAGEILFPGPTPTIVLGHIETLLGTRRSPKDPKLILNELKDRVPRLGLNGLCLLGAFLGYEDKDRVPAAEAMKFDYFNTSYDIHMFPDDDFSCGDQLCPDAVMFDI